MLIRYYGHVGVASGYGEAAAEFCMALLETGFDVEITTDGTQLSNRHAALAPCLRDETAMSPNPDVVIVHTLPLDCGKVLEASHVKTLWPAAKTIAYTTWESLGLISDPVKAALAPFDQVWVPSERTAASIAFSGRRGPAENVRVVPHACDPARSTISQAACDVCGLHHAMGAFPKDAKVKTPAGTGHVVDHPEVTDTHVKVALVPGMVGNYRVCELEHADPPAPFRFYYLGAWTARKNVEGVVRAYTLAFTSDDDVELVLQCNGAAPYQGMLAALATGVQPAPKITFSAERITEHEVWKLHHQIGHCFVTATRGEAWNLGAFEALLAGRHVISPGHLGSDEFLWQTSATRYDSGNAVPSWGDVFLAPPQPGDPPNGYRARAYLGQGMTSRQPWHDPNLYELAHAMTSAYKAARTHISTSYDPVTRFGRAAVGARIRSILEGEL